MQKQKDAWITKTLICKVFNVQKKDRSWVFPIDIIAWLWNWHIGQLSIHTGYWPMNHLKMIILAQRMYRCVSCVFKCTRDVISSVFAAHSFFLLCNKTQKVFQVLQSFSRCRLDPQFHNKLQWRSENMLFKNTHVLNVITRTFHWLKCFYER